MKTAAITATVAIGIALAAGAASGGGVRQLVLHEAMHTVQDEAIGITNGTPIERKGETLVHVEAADAARDVGSGDVASSATVVVASSKSAPALDVSGEPGAVRLAEEYVVIHVMKAELNDPVQDLQQKIQIMTSDLNNAEDEDDSGNFAIQGLKDRLNEAESIAAAIAQRRRDNDGSVRHTGG